MDSFKTVDEILDFAIEAEQKAVDFYNELSERIRNEEMKTIFLEFAQEEVRHKAKLKKIKEDRIFDIPQEKIADLKISDYVDKVVIKPDMSYQEALIVAMNREKASFNLYTRLAGKTDVPMLKEMFLSLAQEESKHKLRFEMEYDEFVLREN
ncbi:MAG: ferritin family protein [Ignavibacteria bacterium]|jgi:rubrerythrin|nr:ferritin family protein [Ignavibacteria bacterium]